MNAIVDQSPDPHTHLLGALIEAQRWLDVDVPFNPERMPADLNEPDQIARTLIRVIESVTQQHFNQNLPVSRKSTDNVTAQHLARAYCDVVPLSNFPQVMGVARKALRANYPPDVIRAALLRMANDNRSVTTDSLRIEIDGLPAASTRRTRIIDEYAQITAWAKEQDDRIAKEQPHALDRH